MTDKINSEAKFRMAEQNPGSKLNAALTKPLYNKF